MILPKQWRHWCKQAGLKPTWKSRRQYAWYSLKGHGRHWRVAFRQKEGYYLFQVGDTYGEFDRWAVCDRIEESSVPKSRDEFISTVKHLLNRINE